MISITYALTPILALIAIALTIVEFLYNRNEETKYRKVLSVITWIFLALTVLAVVWHIFSILR